MLWLFLAVLSRLFWAGTNFIEQFLSREHKGSNPLAPLALVFLFCLPSSALCFFLSGGAAWPSITILYCAGAAIAVLAGLLPYFYTLKKEDAHNVIPYLELTPVFVIVLACVFKHQTLTLLQSAGAALIVVSSFLFSWNFREGKFKLSNLLVLSFAAFCFAIFQYCNAEAEANSSVFVTASCFYCMETFIGLLIFVASRNIRTEMIETFRASRGRVVVLAMATNMIELGALLAILMAFKLAPSYGHVAALSGLQSIFVFLLALPLGRHLPQHFSPIIFDREQSAKLFLIGTIVVGVYLLTR